MSIDNKIMLGAVCYSPKVVEIWEGFKTFFIDKNLPFDFILYSNYETQVEALFRNEINVAWNSPLAWIRSKIIAKHRNIEVDAISMRDSDCNLNTVIVVPSDSSIKDIKDLKSKKISFGAVDSPQATLIPMQCLLESGLVPNRDYEVVYHNILPGKHGDHIGGEEEGIKTMLRRESSAACLIEGNLQTFIDNGTLKKSEYNILFKTPEYDHCNFTVIEHKKNKSFEKFNEILFEMNYDDPFVRPLLEMEGLRKWCVGRMSNYDILEKAVKAFGVYGEGGEVLY